MSLLAETLSTRNACKRFFTYWWEEMQWIINVFMLPIVNSFSVNPEYITIISATRPYHSGIKAAPIIVILFTFYQYSLDKLRLNGIKITCMSPVMNINWIFVLKTCGEKKNIHFILYFTLAFEFAAEFTGTSKHIIFWVRNIKF